ncbi:MAG: PEP-CTERM sorting domain-containing protein [Anaerolineaceae bacterium]|nr:PEP-CTERM sorting domain-containing protein [Anaerolineaceae bacterium]
MQNNGQIYILSSEFIRAIPEPSSLALFSIGSIGMFAYAWRRRKWTA